MFAFCIPQPLPVTVLGTVPISGNVGIIGTVPVSGTVAISGTVPVSIAGVVVIDDGGVPILVDGSGVTQPVSIAGTVPISVAALPLPAGAATEATLASLNTKVTAVDTGAVVLAAGAATIGKLAANAGVNIGTVAISGTVPISATQLPAALGGAGGVKVEIIAGAVAATVASDHIEGDPFVVGDIGNFSLGVIDVAGLGFSTDLTYSPISLDSRSRTRVSLDAMTIGGGIMPVSGTVAISGTVPVSGTVAISGTVPISAASLPLPAGAATEATLAALNTKVTAVNTGAVVLAAGSAQIGTLGPNPGVFIGIVSVSGTVPISATALPLPAGASTEATLAALNAKVIAVNTGAVVISGALPAGGNTIGGVNIIASLPAGTNNIGDVDIGTMPAITGTVSISGTVPISAASLPLPTGAATQATLAALNTKVVAVDTGAVVISSMPAITGTVAISGTVPISAAALPLPTGASTEATLASLNAKVTAVNTGAVVISGALPAGANAIGKLAANAGVNIGTVAISGTVPVSGTVAITAAALPLPTGAATEATLSALNTKVTAVDTGAVVISSMPAITGTVAISGTVPVSSTQLPAALAAGGGIKVEGVAGGVAVPISGTVAISGTVPISAATLPLPAGAATETTLAALNTKVTAVNTGAVVISAALPAGANAIGKLAANAGVNIGTVAVSASPADPFGVNADAASASGSISAKLRQIATSGIPVTGTVAISAASLPLPTGAATETTLAALNTKVTAVNTGAVVISSMPAIAGTVAISGTVPVSSTQLPVALAAGGGIKVEGVAGGVAQPVSVASLPLPAGAAQEHTSAISYQSVRLTTGVAFYNTVVGTQLPAALAAGGGLKIEGVAGGQSVLVNDAAVASDMFLARSDLDSINAAQLGFAGTDTFTGVANGTTIFGSTASPCYFSVSVLPTGAVTSWDVREQVSLDGTNFTDIIQHTNTAPGSGKVESRTLNATIGLIAMAWPATSFRARCAAIVLGAGTNIVVKSLGVAA